MANAYVHAVVGVVFGTRGLGLDGGRRACGVIAGVFNTVLTRGRPRLVLHNRESEEKQHCDTGRDKRGNE